MKLNIYAIYDRVAEECGPIWAAKSDAVAIRNARVSLKEVRPDEYTLFVLGTFDPTTVKIEGFVAREVLISSVKGLTSGTDVQDVDIASPVAAARGEE